MRSGFGSERWLARAGGRGVLAGLTASLIVGLMACAAKPTASTYAKLDCTELAGEAYRAQQTLVYYAGWQPNGQVMRPEGFLLWPAFAFLEEERGSDSRFDELRNRYLAIADASVEKSCPVSRPPAVNQAGVPVQTVSGDRG